MTPSPADHATRLAVTAINACVNGDHILFASAIGRQPAYDSLWTRDFCHTLFGLIAAGLTDQFDTVIERSLEAIFESQTPSGQIPANIDRWSQRPKRAYWATVDSTLLVLLVMALLPEHRRFQTRFQANIRQAYRWLAERDTADLGLIEQQETTDWLDTIPVRGHGLTTNLLYWLALRADGRDDDAARCLGSLKHEFRVNEQGFLPSWVWKVDRADYGDALGTCLAIIARPWPSNDRQAMLTWLEGDCANPAPLRAIMPPLTPSSRDWRQSLVVSASREPFQYQNGGIWPYLGGWYVLALVSQDRLADAERMLRILEQINTTSDHPFPEWLDGRTGQARGSYGQAWSAGMYLAAAAAVRNRRTFLDRLLIPSNYPSAPSSVR